VLNMRREFSTFLIPWEQIVARFFDRAG
jgi:hypothetical protein